MKKNNRLRTNQDFLDIYRNGKNYWNRNLTIYVKKNNLEVSRFGYSITKKIGNSVERNKIRRKMKEIIRLNLDCIKQGYDIIIIPKKNTVDIKYKELENAILHLLKLSRMLKK